MRKIELGMILLFFICLIACISETKQTDVSMLINDPNSLSNPNEVQVTHLDWNATVDFDRSIIDAVAVWHLDNKTNAEKLILDAKGLDINGVYSEDGSALEWSLKKVNELYGSKLEIAITPNHKVVKIDYHTQPEAAALQWLTPQQTFGKERPFLFSQSQSILARTWIPCQDGPGVRFTYSASVKVPTDLLAVMSASNPMKKNETGIYNFEMKQPIPSYLMAIAVGNIEFQSLGVDCGVYAEPGILEKAVNEFEDLPEMISVAENLYGDYRWERYDVLVLPPSFPFGGMENPRLTFATPTIIAGDKSLVSLVAHELAHSWSGNLVTNGTWEELWLNEGFTVYFEQRIMEALRGRDYSEMLAALSYQGLLEQLEEMKSQGNAADTRLKINLENRNPDEGLTSIPYDKGYLFLRHIEETIGREKFDSFVKQYFEDFGFQVMTSDKFETLLEERVIQGDAELENKLNVEEWIHGEGLPENHPIPHSEKFAKVDKVIADFMENNKITDQDVSVWSTHEWLHFINGLSQDLGVDKMSLLDKKFDLTNSGNAEIQAAWYKLAIQNQYEPAYKNIENFLIHVGRRKFLMPLYRSFKETPDGLEMARAIYEKARSNYHSVSYNSIDELLEVHQ